MIKSNIKDMHNDVLLNLFIK